MSCKIDIPTREIYNHLYHFVEMGKKSESKKSAVKKSKKQSAVVTAAAPEPVAPTPAPITLEAKPVKKAVKKPAAKVPAKPSFTNDDIALRAYFIAEKRQKLRLPGDAHQDWIQAEQELLAESKKKPVAKKTAATQVA